MTGQGSPVWSSVVVAVAMLATAATAHAQDTGDFKTEPDKSMAAAHASFLKKNMDQAAKHLHEARAFRWVDHPDDQVRARLVARLNIKSWTRRQASDNRQPRA